MLGKKETFVCMAGLMIEAWSLFKKWQWCLICPYWTGADILELSFVLPHFYYSTGRELVWSHNGMEVTPYQVVIIFKSEVTNLLVVFDWLTHNTSKTLLSPLNMIYAWCDARKNWRRHYERIQRSQCIILLYKK